MANLLEVKAALRQPYAWPGGYPKYLLMADGEALSIKSGRENYREIVAAHLAGQNNGWLVEAIDVNWEDEELLCAHSGDKIECAYPA